VKLYCWRGRTRNFGDELNLLLWPRLLPGLLDDDDATLFLGIGSVLDARHAPAPVKVVAGAGFGGYQPPPALDENWLVHWVRGPHTARRLGLRRTGSAIRPCWFRRLTKRRMRHAVSDSGSVRVRGGNSLMTAVYDEVAIGSAG
jgi:hypothetical protein